MTGYIFNFKMHVCKFLHVSTCLFMNCVEGCDPERTGTFKKLPRKTNLENTANIIEHLKVGLDLSVV